MKASEAATLAEAVYRYGVDKPVEEVRAHLATASEGSLQPYPASLTADPSTPHAYYIAADASDAPVLLHMRPASSGAEPLFEDAITISRMRPGGEREIVVEAIPFGPSDRENVRRFVEQVDRAFLPRPQRDLPAIATGNRHPEISLPAAFDAFARILANTGVNYASTVQLSATREMTTDDVIARRDGEVPTAAGHTRVSIRHLYHAGLCAAVRTGWRAGYTAEADHFIVTGNTSDEIRRSVAAAKEAIHHAAGYTKFTTDTSRLFEIQADVRHPQPWSEQEIEERFASLPETSWILEEFSKPFDTGESRYQFSTAEVKRLAVKFGRSLLLNEELYDCIVSEKKSYSGAAGFDFEPSLDEAETLTTPAELIFYMHWLKARGRPAQLVPPNLGFKKRQAYPDTPSALAHYVEHKMWPELRGVGDPVPELSRRVAELAAIARHFDGTLSIHSGSGKQPEVLRQIGRATRGRVNYKISGELQLQLFDVLSEQPAGSEWRSLFDRMVDRCNRFAGSGAFGDESRLAGEYSTSYLGDSAKGRVDGNLFLVFWLGNMIGSRDVDGVFFKDKLDRLPADLVREVRRRNSDYIVWLVDNLRS